MLGARPAANITWYNNSIPLQNDEKTGTEIKERSVNIVTASHFQFSFEVFNENVRNNFAGSGR